MSFEFLLHLIDLFFSTERKFRKTQIFNIHDPDKFFHTVFTQTYVFLNAAANTFTHDKNILFLLILTIIDIKTYLQCFSTQQQFMYVPYICIYTHKQQTHTCICVYL